MSDTKPPAEKRKLAPPSPGQVMFGLLVAAFTAGTAGVWLLVGVAWALIFITVFSLAGVVVLARGMSASA